MAWRSTGPTNTALITNLERNNLITSPRVSAAMKVIDRAHFAPWNPYHDSPQPIGYSATISAPHMHAAAASHLLPLLHSDGARVLDVGSGSGYLTAVLAELVGPRGCVVGIDHVEPLVELARANMAKSAAGRDMLESGRVKFVCGDGRLGWEEGAPYDAIHVGAAAAEHHEALTRQLKAPGRLFVPVSEEGRQWIFVINKDERGEIKREKLFGVQYVPLTDRPLVEERE